MKLLIDWEGGSTVINPEMPLVIGRDKTADIQVLGSKVSRRHFRLKLDGQNWKAIDLDSSNESYCEGKPLWWH